MGLRDQAEKAKAEETKSAESLIALEQAQLEQEKQEKAAVFQATYARRNTLKQALEDLQNAKGSLKQTSGKRKAELRNMLSLLESVKSTNPDATLKEAVANPDPEADPDEARYVTATEDVKDAISVVRDKKEALGTLGVESDGLRDTELASAVEKAFVQSDREVRKYVRQNPDSELPEAQEMRAQMVEKVGRKMFQNYQYAGYNLDALSEAFEKSLTIDPRDQENLQRNYDEAGRQNYYNQRISQALSKVLSKKSDLEAYTKTLSSVPQEDAIFAKEALTEFLVSRLAGGAGVYGVAAYGEGVSQSKEALLLGKSNFREVDDRLRYEDNSGLNKDGKQVLMDTIDRAPFAKVVDTLAEIVQVRKELQDLPKQQEDLIAQTKELSFQEKKLVDLQSRETRITQQIAEAHQNQEALATRLAEFQIMSAGTGEASKIRAKQAYGEMRISISHFDDQLQGVDAEITSLREAAEEKIKESRQAYREARAAKRGFFNKKELQVAEERASLAVDVAEKKLKNIASDPEFAAVIRQRNEIVETYNASTKNLKEVLKNLGMSDEISGENFQDFKKKVAKKVAETIVRRERDIGELQVILENNKAEQQVVASDLESIRETLRGKPNDNNGLSSYFRDQTAQLKGREQRLLDTFARAR